MIIRKVLTFIILGMILTLGENAMAKSTLNTKQRSIATVAAYVARGDQDNLKRALMNGLDAGVTVNEFKEVLIQAYAYCGFPRSLNALTTLMQVDKERGHKDPQGKLPKARPQGNSLDYGTANQTKLIGSPVQGELFTFAPAIDEYLKAHLFGDIFARDNISWQIRELATIAMLAAETGVDSQLESHIKIGKRNGLTDTQIQEILEIADQTGTKNVLFGLGDDNVAYAQYFTGKSYLRSLTQENINVANVTFEPKCRNNWHIHHKSGQTLLVVAGRGYYQEWGKPVQELKAGDVVNIPEGVKHWHGAAKDSWFTHLAISVPTDGATTEWLESVSEAEYNRLD